MLPKRVSAQGIGRSSTQASWVQESDRRAVLRLAVLRDGSASAGPRTSYFHRTRIVPITR